MENLLFIQMERVRSRTIQVFEAIPEEIADIIPPGFNNSIRWQFGHILTIQERYAANLSGEPLELPDDYSEMFENGTKPADWTKAPPSLQIIKEHLQNQPKRIIQKFSGKLENKLPEPKRGMETVGEILIHTVFHEGMHLGWIAALKRAVAAMRE